jgi:DNA-binding NtrC family response regulator
VVEDEAAICKLLEITLKQLGHRPRVVQRGREALAMLAGEMPDVVLTDLGLPDLSGEEVARAVRERSPETPVVLLTGWADQLRAEARCVPGVTRLLGKPVTLKSLADTLAAVCPR